MAFVNAIGSEKFPADDYGEFQKSKRFKRTTGKDLGFDYYLNRKGWMNTETFFYWLARFEVYLKKLEESACRWIMLPFRINSETSIVEVVYFSANTTYLMRPLDAGIIAAVKRWHRKCQVKKALNFTCQENKSISSVCYDLDSNYFVGIESFNCSQLLNK